MIILLRWPGWGPIQHYITNTNDSTVAYSMSPGMWLCSYIKLFQQDDIVFIGPMSLLILPHSDFSERKTCRHRCYALDKLLCNYSENNNYYIRFSTAYRTLSTAEEYEYTVWYTQYCKPTGYTLCTVNNILVLSNLSSKSMHQWKICASVDKTNKSVHQ